VIFDLGTQSALALPTDLYNKVIYEFFISANLKNCQFNHERNVHDCAYKDKLETLPPLEIKIGQQVITLYWQDYAYPGYEDQLEDFLQIAITEITTKPNDIETYVNPAYNNTIILGSKYLMRYYSIFSVGDGKGTLSLYNPYEDYHYLNKSGVDVANTKQDIIHKGRPKKKDMHTGFQEQPQFLISLAILVVLAFVAAGVIFCCRRYEAQKAAKYDHNVGYEDVDVRKFVSQRKEH